MVQLEYTLYMPQLIPNLSPQGVTNLPLKAELDLGQSYLATIRNSVGTQMFRNRYYTVAGQPLDVIDNGDLACALYVSSILKLFDLIPEVHTTVAETIRHMIETGWTEIPEPRDGAVIVWGVKKRDDGTQGSHRHIGFCMGADSAISNSPEERAIAQHHITYGTFPSGEVRRDISAFYWHSKLDRKQL
jgi:hypothetical protein